MEKLHALFWVLLILTFLCKASIVVACPSECNCFGYPGVWIVNCARRRLSSIPSGIPENTTELFLQENSIQELAADVFSDSPNIEYLYLHENEISTVDRRAFAGIQTNLKYLTLSHNKIAQFPDDVFANMTSLMVLNVNDNNLTTIQANLLDDVTNLVQISFCKNRLTSIDEEAFTKLSKLRYVGLSANSLSGIPTSVGQAADDMYVIDYAENQLQSLPKIPANTQQIYASDNFISSLAPDPLSNASTLYELFLDGNNITGFENNTFRGAPNTGWLDLSRNNISLVDDAMFQGLNQLVGLYLTSNKLLTSISTNAFQPFEEEIYRLLLDDCALTWINPDTINSLQSSDLYIWAGSNPWDCDCDFQDFVTLVRNRPSLFYDVDNMTCSFPASLNGQRLDSVEESSLRSACSESGPSYNETALIICMSVLAVILIVAIAVFFKIRENRKKSTKTAMHTTNSEQSLAL